MTHPTLDITPERLGAKPCPNCKENSVLEIKLKQLASRTYFAELTCKNCLREAVSEVQGSPMNAIRQSVERWNSKWPDIAYYLESDTEGMKA